MSHEDTLLIVEAIKSVAFAVHVVAVILTCGVIVRIFDGRRS